MVRLVVLSLYEMERFHISEDLVFRGIRAGLKVRSIVRRGNGSESLGSEFRSERIGPGQGEIGCAVSEFLRVTARVRGTRNLTWRTSEY